MTKKELAALAAEECCSALTTAHHGSMGRPFWNGKAFQFMYVPAFQFAGIPGCRSYRYDATGSDGKTLSFCADDPAALLTPVWRELPEGVVTLRVYSQDKNGNVQHEIGARTFYKLAPFTADYPPAVRSCDECAKRAYDYAMEQPVINHWLEKGVPDPNYVHNIYPSKMISSIIDSMLIYAKTNSDKAEKALQIAKNAADYLIARSLPDGSPLAGLPLTYQTDFCEDPEVIRNVAAAKLADTVMLIYPAHAAASYLNLEEVTGDAEYLRAALRIGDYYRKTINENGSWPLVVSIETGKPVGSNFCSPILSISPMLMQLHRRTGDSVWKSLADRSLSYVEKQQLAVYNWEAQFEDSTHSVDYSNLSHYGPNKLARYYAENYPDSPGHMECARELLRFSEDQFVIWKDHAPWGSFDVSEYHTPAALEQYHWHVPIDASTADFISTYMAMHKVTQNELYLAKARALADSITRVQHENGFIPTHWMNEEFRSGTNFWLNCMFSTARTMAEFGEYLKTL